MQRIINAGIAGWYGHVVAGDTDTDADLEAAAVRLGEILSRLPARSRQRVAPEEAGERKPLNATGRAMIAYLLAHPTLPPSEVAKQCPVPKPDTVLNWLAKHGYIRWDKATGCDVVLHTE